MLEFEEFLTGWISQVIRDSGQVVSEIFKHCSVPIHENQNEVVQISKSRSSIFKYCNFNSLLMKMMGMLL